MREFVGDEVVVGEKAEIGGCGSLAGGRAGGSDFQRDRFGVAGSGDFPSGIGAGEAEALGEKSAAALDLLFTVAQRLNALTNADVDELGKASGIVQSAGSGSG